MKNNNIKIIVLLWLNGLAFGCTKQQPLDLAEGHEKGITSAVLDISPKKGGEQYKEALGLLSKHPNFDFSAEGLESFQALLREQTSPL